MSQLFFFDAERIRSLAEDETTNQALGTAVKSLLGLDIAERLVSDAALVEARLVKGLDNAEGREDPANLVQEIERIRTQIDALVIKRGEHENVLLRAQAESERLAEEFKAAGGRHWEARGDRKRRIEELQKQISASESQLVSLAATELPLSLLDDLLERVQQQDERERAAAEAGVVRRILAERDDELLAMLAAAKASPAIVQKVKARLARDQESRAAARDVTPHLSLTPNARSALHQLRAQRLAELRREAENLLERRSRLARELADAERDMSMTPDDEVIGQLLKRLRTADDRVRTLSEEAKRIDRDIAERRAESEAVAATLCAIRESEAKQEFAEDDRRRMVRAAGKTRTVMREFLTRATERKIERLSGMITESFRFLLRKRTLVERIHIDPSTFATTLYSRDGHALAKERLSEGEKQVFAISVLWGLARASAHPLPAIIDTPMARLDAAHRRNLVERYFPNASHQVLILSTDTEVDHQYYKALEPHIARAYHLRYDEETRATYGDEGYFWEKTASEIEGRTSP